MDGGLINLRIFYAHFRLACLETQIDSVLAWYWVAASSLTTPVERAHRKTYSRWVSRACTLLFSFEFIPLIILVVFEHILIRGSIHSNLLHIRIQVRLQWWIYVKQKTRNISRTPMRSSKTSKFKKTTPCQYRIAGLILFCYHVCCHISYNVALHMWYIVPIWSFQYTTYITLTLNANKSTNQFGNLHPWEAIWMGVDSCPLVVYDPFHLSPRYYGACAYL